MCKIRKGSLVVLKSAFGEPILEDKSIIQAFAEIFGEFAIVISNVYHDEEEGEVVDIWFTKDITFTAIPISRLKILEPK